MKPSHGKVGSLLMIRSGSKFSGKKQKFIEI
jgi:hypothetical protein